MHMQAFLLRAYLCGICNTNQERIHRKNNTQSNVKQIASIESYTQNPKLQYL